MATDYLKKYGITAPTVKKNPAKRKGTAKPTRKSQATGKPPSKRLVSHRKKNTVPGTFPNSIKPSHKKAIQVWAVQVKQGAAWKNIGMFYTDYHADQYARAIHLNDPAKTHRVEKMSIADYVR